MDEIRGLRNQLDSVEDGHHQLRHQLCIAYTTLASKEKELSTLAGDYYRMKNCRQSRAFYTNNVQDPKRVQAPYLCGAFPFLRFPYFEDEDHGLMS